MRQWMRLRDEMRNKNMNKTRYRICDKLYGKWMRWNDEMKK